MSRSALSAVNADLMIDITEGEVEAKTQRYYMVIAMMDVVAKIRCMTY